MVFHTSGRCPRGPHTEQVNQLAAATAALDQEPAMAKAKGLETALDAARAPALGPEQAW